MDALVPDDPTAVNVTLTSNFFLDGLVGKVTTTDGFFVAQGTVVRPSTPAVLEVNVHVVAFETLAEMTTSPPK